LGQIAPPARRRATGPGSPQIEQVSIRSGDFRQHSPQIGPRSDLTETGFTRPQVAHGSAFTRTKHAVQTRPFSTT
jgi:hypothetical protein